ncbi:ROK family transcriptional regulator [Streptosporangium sandarakinum]|uniref:Putative NBD/HSP70 family sugar kinase n=1 Tax=Streptosporangium sandarakinum TaxID=1260955 RepID=A0A852V132_9ACTN|nr:ROK family transcriptional regulator [Streptosporangium sandarakinum]NYF42189.1 putative NBD/HSP70 family sugar kinase [Streptosporangium sandarakinum]
MKTATPATARAINDRLVLDLLLERGPLTAPQLRELTGLSRPTVSDLIERLRDGGLIEVAGECGENRRGPNARLFGIVAGRAHVAGVDVRRTAVNVTVADITGRTVGSAVRDLPGSGSGSAPGSGGDAGPGGPSGSSGTAEPGGTGAVPAPPGSGGTPGLSALIGSAVAEAAAGRALDTVVLGAPGLVDPRHGDLVAPNDVPGWEPGLLQEIRRDLDVPVTMENEVNLAAVTEHRTGAATGRDDFVLLWLDDGLGSALVLDGRVRRGASGGAGEIGILRTAGGSLCDLVVADVLRDLSRDDAAGRIAACAFALVAILDPGLVILGGSIGREGGDDLAELVEGRLRDLSPAPTEVRASTVEGNAVLQGAVLTALDLTRDRVFG